MLLWPLWLGACSVTSLCLLLNCASRSVHLAPGLLCSFAVPPSQMLTGWRLLVSPHIDMLALAAWMRLACPSPDSSSLYRVQRGSRSYIGAPRMSPKFHQASKQAVKLPDARRPLQ
eukprot:COSAG04_NODE_14305_length_573_cov_0.983122_2_plen_115_part_01